MFWKPKISVNYNNRLKRVVLYFKVSECFKSRKPPSQPLSKARVKLNQELEDGQIEYYELYDRAFSELWQHIRKHEDDYPPDKMLEFKIASGPAMWASRMQAMVAVLAFFRAMLR